jgi:hypothetical protein
MLCFGIQLKSLMPVCQSTLKVPPLFGVTVAGVVAVGDGAADVTVGEEVGDGVVDVTVGEEVGVEVVVLVLLAPQPLNSKLPTITIASARNNNFFVIIIPDLLYLFSGQ